MKHKLTKVRDNLFSNVVTEFKQLRTEGVYGGQMMSDAVCAAYLTIDDDRLNLHSIHLYFVKHGLLHVPFSFHVTRIFRSSCGRYAKR